MKSASRSVQEHLTYSRSGDLVNNLLSDSQPPPGVPGASAAAAAL